MDWMSVSVLLVSLSGAPAQAAQAPAPPPPPPAFEGSAELSYVGTTGNSETQSLGAGTVLTFRPGEWTLTNKMAIVRNEDNGTVRAQSSSISTQAGRHVTPRLSVVGSHAWSRDRFAGIRNRNAVEGGLTFDAIATERHSLLLEGGVGYATEQRLTGADVSSAIGTSGAAYKLAISDTASFENEARAVFSLEDGRDQRLTNVASLSARLNSLLSLKATHTTRWVRRPAPGFKTTDMITAVALVAKF
jgi:putative salt-induced outer membrane protein